MCQFLVKGHTHTVRELAGLVQMDGVARVGDDR